MSKIHHSSNGHNPICGLCFQPIKKGERVNDHHPIYKSEGGIETVEVHQTCHVEFHSANGDFKTWDRKGGQNVPAGPAKLFPPQKRDSLVIQIRYWKEILKQGSWACIYSGVSLKDSAISLDHYLPWSFVAHDQLWNLIPTLAVVNSAKSDRLPANAYFEPFVKLQHKGLLISHQTLSERRWEKQVESFIADLKLGDKRDLLDLDNLRRAYQQTVLPLLELAKGLGFSPDWQYQISV